MKDGAKSKNPKLKSAAYRPWGTFAALAVGALTLYVLAWIGAQTYGMQMARFFATDHATAWTHAVVGNFSNKESTFKNGSLRINDKYALKDFQKGTTIFRYRLVDADGRIFWSSKFEETGMREKRSFFASSVKKGQTVTRQRSAILNNVDELATLKATNGDAVKATQKRVIAEVFVPVKANGKVIGAIAVFDDITDLVAWAKAQAQQIALFFCAAITIVFLIVAALIWAYGSARLRQNSQLIKARQTAEDAEAEARDMAEKLQTMNDEIVDLNKELQKNMQTLHNTQEEVIRKGKMAQLGQLTATVAHDIRNPLGSIRTSTFLLRRKFLDENPKMEKPLTRIETGIERCNGIITELLDFARTKELDVRTHNVDDWIVNVVRETAEALPHEVSFKCGLGTNGIETGFDSDSMRRAVVNFLTNASEAMVGKGNDRPAVTTQNPLIMVNTKRTARGIEISVTDNGPGISPENMVKILDPLFTTKSFGVGLGLPSVEQIFEKHGGGLEVTSNEGEGATFTGWFPIRDADAAADSNEQKTSAA